MTITKIVRAVEHGTEWAGPAGLSRRDIYTINFCDAGYIRVPKELAEKVHIGQEIEFNIRLGI